MKIKICGITSAGDAALAEELGADFIGLIFAEDSPRCVSLKQAGDIVAALRSARPVGVFTRQPLRQIVDTANSLQLFGVQLYRDTDPRQLPGRFIRALRVRDRRSLRPLQRCGPDYFLLDTFDPQRYGGSGRTFDWDMLPANLDRVILSGGIGPHNVRRAASRQPFAIDVCSGVERRPGIKDAERLRALFTEARP